MLRVGLTGSIGMGKSATAAMFAEAGLPVFDADAAVHALYARGGAAVAPVGAAFPGAVRDGAIDRAALADLLAADAEGFSRLEAIVHPLVGAMRADFISEAEASDAPAAVFDIPLLFETGQAGAFDAIVVATAPEDVQRERVLARFGMTGAKLDAILARQTPDTEKRGRADFVIDTSRGFDAAREQVAAVIAALKARANTVR